MQFNNLIIFQWAERREQVLTCHCKGNYEEGTEVSFCNNLKEDNQKFKFNFDGTISPVKALGMVIGMETTSGT